MEFTVVATKKITCSQIHLNLTEMGFCFGDYYLLCNGKRVGKETVVENAVVTIIPRVLGGKGGFGSMLRAIGAQIEKTTNREACRDLSGRRLRDINEEQRLKNWIAQQAEREKEAKEKKKKKLERLCEQPKHEFKDELYDKERSELPEKIENAVLKGLEASCSTKRKASVCTVKVVKKKAKLWIDDGLEDDVSSSGDESDENNTSRPLSASVSVEKSEEVCQSSEQEDKLISGVSCIT